MRVVRESESGVVVRVYVVDSDGAAIVAVARFLSHLKDSGYSPNTLCAYAYDLRRLFLFLEQRCLEFESFGPATALEFLGYLRRAPSRGPAQRLGLAGAPSEGRLLAAAPGARAWASTSGVF